MANPTTARSMLPTLPPELLGRVFDLVDDGDLINLRLVCKTICAAANRPFAICFFGNCQHVVTQHSIQALVDITAHEVFSLYIKTVTICSARIADRIVDGDNTERAFVDTQFVRSGQFDRLLKIAFANIRQTSRCIAVGVSEEYLWKESSPHSSLSPKRRPYGWRTMLDTPRIIYKVAETLNMLLAAAAGSGCQINGLTIVYCTSPASDDKNEMKKALEKYFQTCASPLDLYFDWKDFPTIDYRHREEHMTLLGRFVYNYAYKCAQLRIDAVVNWILKQPMSQLHADSFEFSDPFFSDIYFADSLENIMLSRIELRSSSFGKESYSELFKRLAAMPNLRTCELYKLKYHIPRRRNERFIELRSGTFPAKRKNLYLLFPNDQICLNISGENVSQQSLDLAAYTLAAERKTMQTIEADGEVKYPWVSALGTSHEPRKCVDDDLGLHSDSDDDGLYESSEDEEEYEEEEEASEDSEDSVDSEDEDDEDVGNDPSA